jgi:hypothetical protein
MRHVWRTLASWMLVAACGALPAAGAVTTLEGTIFDAEGTPVPGCRVVVRQAGGDGVFVSTPSAPDGSYSLELPSGDQYVVVAAVSPLGGRATVPDSSRVSATPGVVHRDIHLPMSAEPGPRHAAKVLDGSDRLYLTLVEDPLLVERWRWEVQAQLADIDYADRYTLQAIGAMQLPWLPRVELGARAGLAMLGGADDLDDDTGSTDLDLWGKLHAYRSSSGKLDLSVGALATLPTGDDSIALGSDALQSKLFLGASRALSSAVLVGHLGLRTTEDGTVAGKAVEGKLSGTASAGIVVPFNPKASFVVEANYEGSRFEETFAESFALFGVNWRAHMHGTLRGAVAGGLTRGSPDFQLIVGYARDY